jgi:hypothetical protein
MTGEDIKRIAADAALLLDELKDLEFNVQDCMAMVAAAMPAIVAANARSSRCERSYLQGLEDAQ